MLSNRHIERQLKTLGQSVIQTLKAENRIARRVEAHAIQIRDLRSSLVQNYKNLTNRVNGMDYNVAEAIDNQRQLSDRLYELEARVHNAEELLPKQPIVDHSRDFAMGNARRTDNE